MAKFRKGEIAVLLNDGGGRLFEIYRYVSRGNWQEKSSFASQQPYAPERHETRLVKCKNEAHAVALVEALEAAHQVYRDEEAKAKRKRDNVQRQILIDHNLTLEGR